MSFADTWRTQRFARHLGDYYEDLASWLEQSKDLRLLDVFTLDAQRFQGTPRGVLSAIWADRYQETGANLAQTWEGFLPADDIAVVRAQQDQGGQALVGALRDLARTSRIKSHMRQAALATVGLGVLALLFHSHRPVHKGEIDMKKRVLQFASAASLLALAACGGGGGSTAEVGGGGAPVTDGAGPQQGDDLVTTVAPANYSGPYANEKLAVFNLLNDYRSRCGFGKVAQNALIDQAAQNHADYLRSYPLSGHEEQAGNLGFTGFAPGDRFTAVGYTNVITPWMHKIEKESGGRIQFQGYASMQMGGAPAQLFDQSKDGVVDVIWSLAGYTPGRFLKAEVFELPFFTYDGEGSSRAVWEYVSANAADEFREVKLLAAHTHGLNILHMKNKAITRASDLKGLKVRGPSRRATQFLQNVGAIPVGMPLPSIPDAISKGVIDGAIIPWDTVPSAKLGELAKYRDHTRWA